MTTCGMIIPKTMYKKRGKNMYNSYSNKPYLNDTDMYSVHLRDIAKKLSDMEWRGFEIIVSSGVSEEKDAKEAIISVMIAEDDLCISEDTAWHIVKSLVKIGLYDAERLFTEYRNFNLLKLAPLGARLYRERFRKEPPDQEHMLLAKEHASVLHGYMIKDTATVLMKKGVYNEVSTHRKRNRIQLPDGSIFIPDVIGVKEDKSFDCFEVECGNHNQADFNAKCNKLIAIRNIIIVGQNRDNVTKRLKVQVENWIKAVGKNRLAMSGVKVYLYSLTDLSKNQVTYYYDMVSDEPMCCFKKPRKEVEGNEG